MRSSIVACLALSATGCNSWSLGSDLDGAYRTYDEDDCAQVMLDLSRAEWRIRARPYLQPEISSLRGQHLERQSLFVDAVQTYHFIIARYPTSEYAYRAKARLETLCQLGRLNEAPTSANVVPTRLQAAGRLGGRSS